MDIDQLIAVLIQDEALLGFVLSKLSDSEQSSLLHSVSAKLLDRFQQMGSMNDLNYAIDIKEQAIKLTPEDHPDRATYLNNLGIALQTRFERTGSMDDLDCAIVVNEQAAQLIPDNHSDPAATLNNLGSALQRRFERTGSMDDLDRAIAMQEQAIQSTPDGHPDRAMYLTNLGKTLQSRFQRTGSLHDLDCAIETSEKAVQSTPDDHPNRAGRLNNLGNALQRRFERTGSVDCLNRAIVTREQAIHLIPDDYPNWAMYLSNLGIALRIRFEQTGSMDDLDRAIVTNEQAVKSTPHDHPDRAGRMTNFAAALQRRFERTGSIDDLDCAIVANEQAVQSIPDNHSDHVVMLNNLGSALQMRFERTGLMDYLDRAIVIKEQAVKSTPKDHPDRAAYLNNLGNALQSRFERTGSMDDLDRAILTKKQAIELTPDDHPNRMVMLNNLGSALQSRFERMGSMDDLIDAIARCEDAVQSAPDDHPDRVMYLNNLGNALLRRFERIGSVNDLYRAVMTNEQVVRSTPNDRPDRAMYLCNLGIALRMLFDQTGLMDKLDSAIVTSEQAVQSTPEDHPDRAIRLNSLGIGLQKRFGRTASTDDRDRAIVTWEQVLRSDTAPPSIRLGAATFCSNLLISQGSYQRARLVLQAALQLLPLLSPRILERNDQQYNISQFFHVPSRTVSLSLEDGEDPYIALHLLEFGRGILANLHLEVRSDISILAASHSELAQQFQELRDKIDSPSRLFDSSVITRYPPFFNPSPDMTTIIKDRRNLFNQFDDLLQRIRRLSGFENFLQGPSESELRGLAAEGPIVIFNVSDIRSDAFIVTTNEIRSLHLPLLTLRSLRDFTILFFNAITIQCLNKYSHARDEMNKVLKWLWDVATSPILDELGFTQVPDNEVWPRVWWIGSGLLNILPIHASGYHDSTPPRTVLDRVISSYAPSVNSFSYARERETGANRIALKDKAVLVAMPTTPGQTSLSYVKKETKDLQNLFSRMSIDATVMQNPTRAEVLHELPRHTIVHFACHGNPAEDPSQSCLLLEDWKISPLTVSDLTALNIVSAKFAYLSACHTSTMRNFRLLDESISLSSAIQLSGYPSVVGSLWQVTDRYSAEIARNVYSWIVEGEGRLNVRRSAEGLHRAVCDLRHRSRFRGKHDPLVWASFIHVGI